MRWATIRIAILLSASALLAACAASTRQPEASTADKELKQGQHLYAQHCAGCHGVGGDGEGFERVLERIKPRDLTQGQFKYKSTSGEEAPTDADLSRTIAKGITRTSMPHHSFMDEDERAALVRYVKTFYSPWQATPAPAAIEIPPVPKYFGSNSSVQRGKLVYDKLGCAKCHGTNGDGVTAVQLPADRWGAEQKPAALNQGKFQSGRNYSDIYRTIMVGLNGTSMSAYGSALTAPDGVEFNSDDAWHLVYYIVSLQSAQRNVD